MSAGGGGLGVLLKKWFKSAAWTGIIVQNKWNYAYWTRNECYMNYGYGQEINVMWDMLTK